MGVRLDTSIWELREPATTKQSSELFIGMDAIHMENKFRVELTSIG